MSYVSQSYRNLGPNVAYPDSKYEPVPGWGMRPKMAGPPIIGIGLGYDLPINTPVGNTSISVPLEKVAQDTVDMIWPEVRKKMYAEIPGLVNALKEQAYKELPTLTAKVRDSMVNEVMPAVEPRAQSQIDSAMAKLETKLNENQKRMTMIVIGGAVAAIGVSLFISMSK